MKFILIIVLVAGGYYGYQNLNQSKPIRNIDNTYITISGSVNLDFIPEITVSEHPTIDTFKCAKEKWSKSYKIEVDGDDYSVKIPWNIEPTGECGRVNEKKSFSIHGLVFRLAPNYKEVSSEFEIKCFRKTHYGNEGKESYVHSKCESFSEENKIYLDEDSRYHYLAIESGSNQIVINIEKLLE